MKSELYTIHRIRPKNYKSIEILCVIIFIAVTCALQIIILSNGSSEETPETPVVLFPKEIEINFPTSPDNTIRNIGTDIPENVKYSTKPNSKGGLDHNVQIFNEMSHSDSRSMHPVIHIDNSASASDIISSIEIP